MSVSVTTQGGLHPPHLCDKIHCECRPKDDKCSSDEYGCHKEYRSCMAYCHCSDEDVCCSPYTNTARDKEGVEVEDAEEDDLEDESIEDEDVDDNLIEDVECGFLSPDYQDDA